MAQTQMIAEPPPQAAQGAVLRPGRAADEVPVNSGAPNSGEVSPVAAGTGTGRPADAGVSQVPDAAGEDEGEGQAETGDGPESGQARKQAESRLRQLRLMLRQCDRVLLLDFELLAMSDWPDNYTLAVARRFRDLWLFGALVSASVFLSGLTGFVPAWLAGGGFGAFVIILLLGIPPVRRLYTSTPSYLDLVLTRQRMLRDAWRHIAHLEGKDGLIWQCARMAEFNPALANTRFSELLRLSEQHILVRNLTRREHVRLYLIYLLEAEKAYERLQKVFLEENQKALDRGWRNAVATPEPRA